MTQGTQPWRRSLSGRSAAIVRRTVAAVAVAITTACDATGEGALPPEVPDPTTVQTSAGATAFYRQVTTLLAWPVDRFVADAALLTDELAALPLPLFVTGFYTSADSRDNLAAIADAHFDGINMIRNQAREARGFVGAYAPDSAHPSSPALRAHLLALEGYAEIYLADLFCSGIPLSTVDFGGDYTLAVGSTTKQVYEHAVALFDSARVLFDSAQARGADSVRLRHFAAIGRGRALLALGRIAEAAAAVAEVPTTYRYEVLATDDPATPHEDLTALRTIALSGTPDIAPYPRGLPSVGDREGGRGLEFRSSGDPRVNAIVLGQDVDGDTIYLPGNYALDGSTPMRVAEGAEARLIEAEAALAGGGDWLGMLNALRTSCVDVASCPTPAPAGGGGVAGLPLLEDPGTPGARVDLLFRERAFWLYFTGHRQGDLRRLLRQYPGRTVETVYPSGPYQGGSGRYGAHVVVPVPAAEQELNPKYTGCINLNP